MVRFHLTCFLLTEYVHLGKRILYRVLAALDLRLLAAKPLPSNTMKTVTSRSLGTIHLERSVQGRYLSMEPLRAYQQMLFLRYITSGTERETGVIAEARCCFALLLTMVSVTNTPTRGADSVQSRLREL